MALTIKKGEGDCFGRRVRKTREIAFKESDGLHREPELDKKVDTQGAAFHVLKEKRLRRKIAGGSEDNDGNRKGD